MLSIKGVLNTTGGRSEELPTSTLALEGEPARHCLTDPDAKLPDVFVSDVVLAEASWLEERTADW